MFVVSAPINGQLQRINLDAGDPVVAEQTVVARIWTCTGLVPVT
ncbi:MAG: hypothetical protein V7676_14270 [Parasphingorhabdus sp.]